MAETNVLGFTELYGRLDEAERRQREGAHADEASRARVLAERARRLAQAREQVRTGFVQMLAFRLGSERYGLDVLAIEELLSTAQLSPLPGTTARVLGAVVSRLRVVAVLDLRYLLGVAGTGMSDLTTVMVLSGGSGPFAIAVDEVDGLVEIPAEELPASSDGPILHVRADRLCVLDVQKLRQAQAPALATQREG